MKRRKFLKVAATVAAGGAGASCGGPRSPYRFFTQAEAETLSAICEQLIPADEDPGAAWAGVVNYMDRQLVGHFKRYQADYRAGLAAVERTAQAQHGKRFTELAATEQAGLLAGLETNEAPAGVWQRIEPREFFDLVFAHTMQGFYGMPRHGGNRYHASWRMLGVPPTPVRGRLLYELPRKG